MDFPIVFIPAIAAELLSKQGTVPLFDIIEISG